MSQHGHHPNNGNAIIGGTVNAGNIINSGSIGGVINTTGSSNISNTKRKYLFGKEIKMLMYGFGDCFNPRQDSIELAEDMIIDYLSDLLLKADRIAKLYQNNGKLKTDDIMFALRKDPKKLARVEELLYMNDELKRARKAFEMDEVGMTRD